MSALLETTYLGLTLKNPFMLGASPLSGSVERLQRCVDEGCSAIVMHSLFAERIPPVSIEAATRLARASATRPASEVGRPLHAFPLGPDEYLDQIRRIKAVVDVPIIGSINSTAVDGWIEYAPLVELAGASALELNVYEVVANSNESAFEVEQRIESMVRGVKARVRIPVAVKLSPFYTSLSHLATRLDAAGADGLVLFNRFYQPDIDVETLESVPNVHLSTSAELLLRLHWAAILFDRVRASIAVVGGVHTALDGVKALLSGADAVQVVSAVLERGPHRFKVLGDGLRQWMDRQGHTNIESCRGLLSLKRNISPGAFERASYLRVLESWGH